MVTGSALASLSSLRGDWWASERTGGSAGGGGAKGAGDATANVSHLKILQDLCEKQERRVKQAGAGVSSDVERWRRPDMVVLSLRLDDVRQAMAQKR